jgi:hypothetical protein
MNSYPRSLDAERVAAMYSIAVPPEATSHIADCATSVFDVRGSNT